MPFDLKPLPRDPEPTPEDLSRFEDPRHAVEIREHLARITWRIAAKQRDPDAFQVPFATELTNYPSYLNSPVWRRIKTRILRAADGRCAGCRAAANQVHHRDYRPAVLRGDMDAALVPLCEACHTKVHTNDQGGRRNTWQENEAVLADMIGSCPAEPPDPAEFQL